ncbi:MAG: hypothetical protein HKP03_06870 [Xanthomonadales bacterium]|nr:hypothetical protein [Gammaproteobacteria bacterium]NNK38185.1 hypothetical protein [Xanthomonadales bacterium]
MKRWFYLALALLAILLWRDWRARPIEHPPGVLVHESPRQSAPATPGSFRLDEFILERRADFGVRARVLSREPYYLGRESGLSPVDLALGWGAMSDQAVLDRIDIRQGSRWYYTRYELPAPIPDGDIIRSSSNMHIIPANDLVRRTLKRVRAGQVINARGSLVDVDADGDSGFRWRTSMRRDDTGNGSCEIFYVEQLIIEGPS